MRTTFLALLLGSIQACLPQTAILSVTPAAVNLRARSWASAPTGRSVFPGKQMLNLQMAGTAPATWTVTIGGPLSTLCDGPCFRLTEEFSNRPISSGSGSMRVAINWNGTALPLLTPGTYGGTITFTPTSSGPSATSNISITMTGNTDLPASPEVKATAITEVNCTNPNPGIYSYTALCAITNEAPAANPLLTQPAVGDSIIDPNFGGRIRRITNPGCAVIYGASTAFSAKSTYVLTGCGIFRTNDGALVRAVLPGNLYFSFMSGTNDEIYIYMTGSELHSFNFVTGQDIMLGQFNGQPYGFQQLYAGGTASSSSDDWIAFYEYSNPLFPKLCAVNVKALQSAGAPGPGNTYCADYQGKIGLSSIDWAAMSEREPVSGKRYMYVSASPLSVVFSVGAEGSGLLNQEYILPEWPGWNQNNDDGDCESFERCYNANNFTHISLFYDRNNQAGIFGNFEDIYQDLDFVSAYRLGAGKQVLRPISEGGGQTMLGLIGFDRQPGCSWSINGCVITSIEGGRRFASTLAAAVPQANTVTSLTLSSAHSWAAGASQPIRIQNATGSWNCLNGAWTASIVNATQLTIPANCEGATGGLGQTMLGDAALFFTQSPNRSQIQIWRPGRQVHRIGMHRSVAWRDVPGTGISAYESTPRGSISRDGRFVAFASNWGALDFNGVSVYVAETGLGAPPNRIWLKDLSPSRTGAAVSYEIGNGSACGIEVSNNSIFSTPVESFTDTNRTSSRMITLGMMAALSPSTLYWLRITCGLDVETRSFMTLPASVNGPRTLTALAGKPSNPLAQKVILEYRDAGNSIFQATAAIACAAGCSLNWPATAGSVSQYRLVYLDAADTPIETTSTFILSVPR